MSEQELAEIRTFYPGWRGWRTPEGGFAARKGGTAPPGAQARGRTLAELMAGIATAVQAGDGFAPPVLRPHEQAALAALEDATGPLSARDVSDLSGVPSSTTAKALAALRGHGLVSRRRERRVWLYACTDANAAQIAVGMQPGTPVHPYAGTS